MLEGSSWRRHPICEFCIPSGLRRLFSLRDQLVRHFRTVFYQTSFTKCFIPQFIKARIPLRLAMFGTKQRLDFFFSASPRHEFLSISALRKATDEQHYGSTPVSVDSHLEASKHDVRSEPQRARHKKHTRASITEKRQNVKHAAQRAISPSQKRLIRITITLIIFHENTLSLLVNGPHTHARTPGAYSAHAAHSARHSRAGAYRVGRP